MSTNLTPELPDRRPSHKQESVAYFRDECELGTSGFKLIPKLLKNPFAINIIGPAPRISDVPGGTPWT